MESMKARCAVMTISDRCTEGRARDRSGPAVEEILAGAGMIVVSRTILPDDIDAIATRIRKLADEGMDLILTVGGTGLSPRDHTPEATMRVADRTIPGLPELIRSRTGSTFPRAYLSRGLAVQVGRSLVINLPGSPRGASDSLMSIVDLIPHAIEVMNEEPGRPSHGED